MSVNDNTGALCASRSGQAAGAACSCDPYNPSVAFVPLSAGDRLGSYEILSALGWSGLRYQARGPNRMFDVHPDGTRLALGPLIRQDDFSNRDHVTFIFNFFEELRRRTSQ